MKMCNGAGIYRILCIPTAKFYIGSSIDVKSRWRVHQNRLRNGTHHSKKLLNSWRKYGPDAFAFSVLEYVGEKVLREQREQAWIDALSPSFNSCKVVGTRLGQHASVDTRRRISAALTGRKVSDETRALLARTNKGAGLGRKLPKEQCAKISAGNTGKRLTAECKAKISAAHAGKHLSKDQREKLAEFNRGKTLPPETRAKISSSLKGRPRSQETKAKISASHKGKIVSAETRAKMSIAKKGKKQDPEFVKRRAAAISDGYARKRLMKQRESGLFSGHQAMP